MPTLCLGEIKPWEHVKFEPYMESAVLNLGSRFCTSRFGLVPLKPYVCEAQDEGDALQAYLQHSQCLEPFTKEESFVFKRSWTQRSAAAWWHVLQRPRRLRVHTAAIQSVWIVTCQLQLNSEAIERSPIEFDAPRVIPPSLASALDMVTVV